jgi:amino acid transporter
MTEEDTVARTDGGEAISAVDAELNRDIGIVGAIALGVGTMIAAGIFVLSGLAVSNVGAMAIVAFLVAAIVASFTAFAYAEFAAIYPESGGGYAYVANTFDTDLTYIVGWSMILGYPASAAFYLASFSDWFYRFIVPLFNVKSLIPYWIPGLVILGLLVWLNIKGTEESGKFQIAVTALKVVLIGLFLFGGLQAFDSSGLATSVSENLTRFSEIGLTSALVFITFFGFEAIATNAEEIEEPGKNIPRAIFFAMGFVTIVYALVVLVIVFALRDPTFLNQFLPANANLGNVAPQQFVAQNGELAMGYAASYYLGDIGFYVIIVGALFSMLSAANATILAGSRVKLAMSRRNHLPERFEELHPDLNTPYNSVFLTGGLIFAFIAVFTVLFGGGPESEATLHLPLALPLLGAELHLGVEAIAHFADFMLLTGLIVVNLALIQSRRKYPDIERAFEVPGVPVIPAIAVLANLVLVVNVEPSSLLLGLTAELLGIAFWFTWKSRAPPTERLEDETPTAVAEHNPSGRDRDYRIVIPIANPEHTEQLLRTARDIAADRNGEILVLSVVTLPEQTPLSRGHQYVDQRREVLDQAMALLRNDRDPGSEPTPVSDGGREGKAAMAEGEGESTTEATVPISGTVRIAHHVDEAILNTVEQYNSDAVLMGWGGWLSRRRDAVLGSIVDTVVTEATCDVLVERIEDENPGDAESILLPTAGGPHAELAGEVARAIAHTTGASVEVLRVVDPDASDQERSEAQETVDAAVASLEGIEGEGTVVENDDIADGIIERSEAHELTILGATREGLLERFVLGSIPERIGERAESTIILTKRNLGITSRMKRLFGRE